MYRRFVVLMFGSATLLLLASLQTGVQGVAVRDGFNLYKDFLRGKGEETGEQDPEDETVSPKIIYFYRTPKLNVEAFDQQGMAEHGKRTSINKFKNYMIARDALEEQLGLEDHVDERSLAPRSIQKRGALEKRGPGSILYLALANRRPFDQSSFQSDLNWKNSSKFPGHGFVASMGKRAAS